MKRILSFTLCLLMLVSLVPLFASCGPNSKKKIDLSDYQVIYGNKNLSERFTISDRRLRTNWVLT